MKNKHVLSILVFVLIAAGLQACGGAGGNGKVPAGTGTVTFKGAGK